MFSGDTIGKYRLLSCLGRGGMGEVWRATASGHGGFKKTVVIKTLLPELACDPLFIDMLAHEARICAKLSHPNLIEVFDFVEHGGIHLLAMEYVDGKPLNQVMRAAHKRGWKLPAWFALRVAWDCCRGLECAHEEGIVHCDLSPSNVMITFTGVTKILDFGVAHSCKRGPRADRLKGKFPYMSPERIKSRETDRRTDIYALGVMLYLLFTGELPFTADNDAALLHKIVTQMPRPPSAHCEIDPRIEQIILRAMQPDPEARHQSATEVLAALSPCLDGLLGTYGQQEVAALVKTLFDDEDTTEAVRARQATTDAVAILGGSDLDGDGSDIDGDGDDGDDEISELSSRDIEVDDVRPSTVPASPAAFPHASPRPRVGSPATFPHVSPTAFPHASPRPRGTILPPTSTEPRPVTQVFAPSAPSAIVHETRTTVQSLFGTPRRPAHPEPVTRIFDRPESPRADGATDHWPWPTSRSKS